AHRHTHTHTHTVHTHTYTHTQRHTHKHTAFGYMKAVSQKLAWQNLFHPVAFPIMDMCLCVRMREYDYLCSPSSLKSAISTRNTHIGLMIFHDNGKQTEFAACRRA